MQEQRSPLLVEIENSEKRKKKRNRILGYFSRIYREAVNGADTLYTVVKASMTVYFVLTLGAAAFAATGAALISGLAIPIVVAAGIGALIYISSAAKEQYDLNADAEKKKIEEENLKRTVKAVENEVNQRLVNEHLLSLENSEPLIYLEKEDESIEAKGLEDLNNNGLLKLVLRNYLKKLGLLDAGDDFDTILNKKRKTEGPLVGTLPGQSGMINLIESVTGFKRNDPLFAAKVKAFLEDQDPNQPKVNVSQDFSLRVIRALNLGNPETEEKIDLYPQKRKTLLDRALRFVKNAMFFVHRSNTAMGLVLGTCVLFGLLVVGTPVAWPIYVVGAIVALTSGTASIIYSRYVEKWKKQEDKEVDFEIKESKTRYKLLYKLNRLRTKEYEDGKGYDPEVYGLENYADDEKLGLLAKPKPAVKSRIPLATRIRMHLNTATQAIYGASVGTVVGIAITGVILILSHLIPPVGIALTIVTVTAAVAASVGGVYGIRYGFWLGKTKHREGKKEREKIEEVAELQQNVEKRFGRELVSSQLAKSKQELVAELLDNFVHYSKQLDNPSTTIQVNVLLDFGQFKEDVLSKKEKILLEIEEATGIKRVRDENSLPDNNDDKFFNDLALYLQKDKKLSESANEKVTQFKASVLGKEVDLIDPPQPSKKPTWTGFKAGITRFNRFALKNVYPIIGALGVAIPLGFMLFGPTVLIPVAIVFASVMTVVIANKVLESRAAKNLEKQADIEAKLPLIEVIAKTAPVDSPKVTKQINMKSELSSKLNSKHEEPAAILQEEGSLKKQEDKIDTQKKSISLIDKSPSPPPKRPAIPVKSLSHRVEEVDNLSQNAEGSEKKVLSLTTGAKNSKQGGSFLQRSPNVFVKGESKRFVIDPTIAMKIDSKKAERQVAESPIEVHVNSI